MIFYIIVAIIILFFAVMSFFRELSRYRVTHNLPSLVVRLSMSVLLIFMVLSIWIGVVQFGLDNPVGIFNIWGLFWFSQFMLGFSIIILAYVEIRYNHEFNVSNKARVTVDDLENIIASHNESKNNDEE